MTADTHASLLRSQRAIKAKLTTIDKDLASQNGAKLSQIRFDKTMEKLQQCSESIESHHARIYPLCTDTAEEDAQDAEYDLLYNRYLSALEELEILRPDVPAPIITPASAQSKMKLPDLPTPHFDGNLNDWMSFRDLFNTGIDSSTLPAAQKLHYLKNCLSGEAKNVIKHLEVSESNYTEAWKLLNDRFDNKREIITAHLRRLTAQPAMKDENAQALRKLIDTTKECFQSLRVLKQPVQHWDSWLIFIISEKLDPETHRQWILTIKPDQLPTYDELCNFLEQRCRAITESGTVKPKSHSNSHSHPNEKKVSSHHGSVEIKCRICNQPHLTYKCPNFHNQSIPERRETIKTKNLCFNCLAAGHKTVSCPSSFSCKKCHKKHHTLVHLDNPTSDSTPTVSSFATLREAVSIHVLLPTAIVNVQDKYGALHPYRALLDSASEVSFVSEKCIQQLGLPTKETNLTITGVSASSAGSSTQIAQLQVSSRIYTYSTTLEAYVMKKVTGKLPSSPVPTSKLTHIEGLKLADPFYYKPEEVDILIGADLFASLLRPTPVLKGPRGSPHATDTVFGWVVSGRVNSSKQTIVSSLHIHCQLESIMQKFWELESIPDSTAYTNEEEECERHFLANYKRTETGRYMVRLPLKSSSPALGTSRDMAVRRLMQVERRLNSNPQLRTQYIQVMREYQRLGHMEKVPADQVRESSSTYYMPHHCVIKESSTSTRVRVVFDASAKSSSGISLNDKCMVGPKTQDELYAIVLRFRMWLIGMAMDVAKMFPQFLMHPDDRDQQRLVWRENPSDSIEDWRMTGVFFGNASASFLATRCVIQLAKDLAELYVLASKVARRDAYVDDILTGANSRDEAIELQQQLLRMFASAGLELRKWSSNDLYVLDKLPVEFRETQTPLSFDSDDTVKTLGLQWNPSNDMFSFAVNVPDQRKVHTKRTLLSDISKIFDPIGWLSPITIKMKILFQSLWSLNLTWDEPLPSSVLEEWAFYRSRLNSIEEIKIPRHVCIPNAKQFEILGFCDASQKAYAAVLYLKSTTAGGESEVKVLTAKTRVAPAKQESIPRLELCGAALLVELVNSVRKSLIQTIENVYLWTDSTIVLDWISSPSTRWNTFVANRVSKIQQSYPRTHWHHVSSKDNPADIASRGINPSELPHDLLWWSGPSWTLNSNFNFSSESIAPSLTVLEEKKAKVHASNVSCQVSIIDRFHTLVRLKRVVAYCRRFMHNYTHARDRYMLGDLSVPELTQAMNCCIRLTQMSYFASELKCLKLNQPLCHKSKLLCLSPFVDSEGVLRVGGRLRNAPITPDKKFPIILPKYSPLTHLIIADEHVRNLHAGPQLLLSMIQQNYWIIAGRDVVRQFVKKCLVCFRHRAVAAKQKMGDLPASRVTATRPFQSCGVDFAGPFVLRRVIGGRGNQTCKSYVCVFVCFVTHAIHLELVSSLSSEAFLASLKRFFSRRGLSSDIYSDCGTNFVGADKELRRIYEFVQAGEEAKRVQQFLTTRSVSWHFNPPSSPHFGGLWESGVRLVKVHLKRVIGTSSLNFEEFSTVLAQVESCVNSRPLSPLSSDPEDLSALTPGHFLISAPLTAIPEPDLTDLKVNRLSRWQLCQQITQHFWKRWHNEYLLQLQQRNKWNSTSVNVQVGALVLLKDERLPPTEWKLARIIETHPGADGLVRVATIKTATGEFKRPIVKLCPLPLDEPLASTSPIPHE